MIGDNRSQIQKWVAILSREIKGEHCVLNYTLVSQWFDKIWAPTGICVCSEPSDTCDTARKPYLFSDDKEIKVSNASISLSGETNLSCRVKSSNLSRSVVSLACLRRIVAECCTLIVSVIIKILTAASLAFVWLYYQPFRTGVPDQRYYLITTSHIQRTDIIVLIDIL